MIKTFRGLMENGDEDKIRLSTKKGKVGYRIIKFQTIGPDNNTTFENVLKIYKITQPTVNANIDFSDGNLLAATLTEGSTSSGVTGFKPVIFEREIFNQDVYITNSGTGSVNYYIELEVMSLTDNAAAVSTLRDIRLNPQKHA